MIRGVIILTALVCFGPVHAAGNSPQRVKGFAALPNWTGFWEWNAIQVDALSGEPDLTKIRTVFNEATLYGEPPYNAAWDAKYKAASTAMFTSGKATASCKNCGTFGFPAQMSIWGSPLQLLVTPEQTVILFERFEARYIYTDGRKHPIKDDLWPTPEGDSIGRWEGSTLVVDTIARKAGPIGFLAPLALLSEQVHFIERIRMVHPNELEDQMTIEDPVAFVRPWHITIGYRRVSGLDRFIGYGCENDRNPIVDGKVTIAPP
jgi:hypothetical protein